MADAGRGSAAPGPRGREAAAVSTPGWPWFMRLPFPPVWAGVGIGFVIVVGVELAASVSAPIQRVRLPFEWRLPYAIALANTLALWFVTLHVRGARRDFDTLVPRLRGTPVEIAAARAGLFAMSRSVFWSLIALALALMLPVQEMNTQRWSRFASGNWNAWDLFSAVTVSGSVLLLYSVGALVISTALRLRRLGAESVEMRPFDSGVAEPFLRIGLRTVLLFVAIPMVLFTLQQVAQAGTVGTLLLFFATNVVMATAVMIIPVQGLSARTRAWKSAELDRVERAIAGDVAALEGSSLAGRLRDLDIVGLLAYRSEVEAIRALPFDRLMAARFVIYLLLPLASWVAAAFVERGIEKLLG